VSVSADRLEITNPGWVGPACCIRPSFSGSTQDEVRGAKKSFSRERHHWSRHPRRAVGGSQRGLSWGRASNWCSLVPLPKEENP